jgi:hypothetical protein
MRLRIVGFAVALSLAAWLSPAPVQAVPFCSCACDEAYAPCTNQHTGQATTCIRYFYSYCV